jgi:choloylglycine hydrolase
MMKQILPCILAFMLGMGALEACTGLRITAEVGKAVHGRTLEFGIDIKTSVTCIPRGYAFTGETSDGKGLEYTSKYAAVGAMCFDTLALMDGMNEEGLSVGTFYFPGFAGYTPTTKENIGKSLSPIDFPNWILTQFKSLDEVKNGLSQVVIAPTVFKDWGNIVPPFHYIVYDKSGKSIVIEPVDGKLEVFDNPIGVLTNSPDFKWHMTNLRNFINLTPNNVPPLKIDGATFAPFGQGSGMVGLPGDFTPPSRFVRAAIFAITATPVKNANEAVFKVFHLLNQFDIPVGVARQKDGDVVHTDYTLATVVREPSTLRYFVRTYDDQTIRMVDLHTFNKDGKEVLLISTEGSPTYVDISNQLKPFVKK